MDCAIKKQNTTCHIVASLPVRRKKHSRFAKINMLGICAVVSDFSGQEVIYKSLTHKEQRIVRVMRRAPYRRRGGL
jgi:hypothetical protein